MRRESIETQNEVLLVSDLYKCKEWTKHFLQLPQHIVVTSDSKLRSDRMVHILFNILFSYFFLHSLKVQETPENLSRPQI